MVAIKIIVGSTRPSRFGIQPAQWLLDQSKQVKNAEFDLVDLAEINLPLLDEPHQASERTYTREHTKNWAAVIDGADGFVFVTPEYNHSMPAALKNAIDFLYYEWHHKPLCFLAYGGPAGGTRAVEHLRAMASTLSMYDLREQLLLNSYSKNLDENGRYQFSDQQAKTAGTMLKQLAFWAEKMRTARDELGGGIN
jgi:NAD(P)H-dependent FMN reductase